MWLLFIALRDVALLLSHADEISERGINKNPKWTKVTFLDRFVRHNLSDFVWMSNSNLQLNYVSLTVNT